MTVHRFSFSLLSHLLPQYLKVREGSLPRCSAKHSTVSKALPPYCPHHLASKIPVSGITRAYASQYVISSYQPRRSQWSAVVVRALPAFSVVFYLLLVITFARVGLYSTLAMYLMEGFSSSEMRMFIWCIVEWFSMLYLRNEPQGR